MPAPLRKLATLGPRAWADLLRAQAALLAAQWQLRRQPLGSLAIREVIDPAQVRGDATRAHAISVAVQRVAHYGIFRPYCLVQSLALRSLLISDHVDGASIRIGVRRHKGTFQAHAWVRWGETVLGDHPDHVALFTEVDDLRVLGHR